MNKIIIPVLASVLILSFGLTQNAFADFEVIDLGFQAVDINDSGQIIGFDASTSDGVLWDDGDITVFPDDFFPTHINNAGQVAGKVPCPGFPSCVAIWDSVNGVQLLDIHPDQTSAIVNDLNDFGVATGSLRFDIITEFEFRAVLWDPNTGIQDLGGLAGGTFDSGEQINNAGQITMRSRDTDGVMHAVLWEDGVLTDLGNSGHLAPLNEAGQIAAFIDGQGVFWENGVFTDLGDLGIDGTVPRALNDLGQVTGSGGIPNPNPFFAIFHAFIWDSQNGIQDLGTLTGGQFATSIAFDINNAGQVVGFSCSSAGFSCPDIQAFVWDSQNGMQGLDPITPGEHTFARHINEAGQILGSESEINFSPGILWNPATIISEDLNDNLNGGPDDNIIVDGGTVNGNVNVNGGKLTIKNGGTITGNLEASNGATVTIDNANIDGNVIVNDSDPVSITDSEINGNVYITDSENVTVTNNEVNGNLEITGTTGSCTGSDTNNTVSGNTIPCPGKTLVITVRDQAGNLVAGAECDVNEIPNVRDITGITNSEGVLEFSLPSEVTQAQIFCGKEGTGSGSNCGFLIGEGTTVIEITLSTPGPPACGF